MSTDPTSFRFSHRLRVRWAEVDMQKIVFNAHYLMYVDTAISDYWRALAMPYAAAMELLGGDLYVKKASLNYHGSARFDDVIDVALRCERIGNSSVTFAGLISRGGAPLVSAELIYVFADPATQTSRPVPPLLRQMLQAYETGESAVHVQIGSWQQLEAQAAGIRQDVFVKELGVAAELEWDLADLTALHAVATNALGQRVGTARLWRRGHGVSEISRLAVVRSLRGAGFGQQLLAALEQAALARGDVEVVVKVPRHSQGLYAQRAYRLLGPSLDGVDHSHVEMVKPLTVPVASTASCE